jgi:predicted transcriptional regulator
MYFILASGQFISIVNIQIITNLNVMERIDLNVEEITTYNFFGINIEDEVPILFGFFF